MKNISGLFLSFLLALMLSAGSSLAGEPSIALGEQWLKWSDETRFVYVLAYLGGRAHGFVDGCKVGQKMYLTRKMTGLPGESCIRSAPEYSKHLEEYSEIISNYYRSYPEDRNVPVFVVLDGLTDARHLTIQQMHDYYGKSFRTIYKEK